MDVIFLYIMNGNIVDMKNVFQRKIINYLVVAAETFPYYRPACRVTLNETYKIESASNSKFFGLHCSLQFCKRNYWSDAITTSQKNTLNMSSLVDYNVTEVFFVLKWR